MAKNYKPRQKEEEYTPLPALDGKMPPQAVELEEAVLGALMLERDSIITAQEYISSKSFYVERHQLIYQAIEQLNAELKPIDLLTVTEQLRKSGKLESIGGAQFLAQLTQKVASASHLQFHAAIIAQKYIQRELIRASGEIQRAAYSDDKDLEELIDTAESAIFDVTDRSIKRDVQAAKNVFAQTMKAIEEASKKGGAMTGVQSGFTDIDQLTLGWQPSDLIIIAARPSMGKTAFVLTMARNIALDYNKPVAFFSLEMSSTQLMMRLIVGESGLSSSDVRSGHLSPEQWNRLEKSTRRLPTAPLFIDDTPALSIAEFRSKARRLSTQYHIELIVIDYLQLMTNSSVANGGNREQEVSSISRALKAIAKELNIPIIALSQLNRSVESRGGAKRPQLSDLRESGAIEQDADIVAFIHRPEYYKLDTMEDGTPSAGKAEIIIAKHRNGAVDTVVLRFKSEQAKFTDSDDVAVNYTTVESSMNDPMEAAADEAMHMQGGSHGRRLDTKDDESPF